jgi:hypothetical protein
VLFREGLRASHELGFSPGLARGLEGLAGVLAAREPDRAARLFGAAQSVREATRTTEPPDDREEYERDIAVVRATLGERDFARSWEEGRAMTPNRAIAEAVADLISTFGRGEASSHNEPSVDRRSGT